MILDRAFPGEALASAALLADSHVGPEATAVVSHAARRKKCRKIRNERFFERDRFFGGSLDLENAPA
jgi:hypothetical protein